MKESSLFESATDSPPAPPTTTVRGVIVIPVPQAWLELHIDACRGLVWWALMDELMNRRKEALIQPISSVYNVAISFARTPGEVDELELRVNTHAVQADRDTAKTYLEAGEYHGFAFVEFAYETFSLGGTE